jgi:hypothetical protein
VSERDELNRAFREIMIALAQDARRAELKRRKRLK